ncbi:YqhV family protein [Virgibacillus halodenitrificans]|uniref:YqhV family protein n=1 Tax=Virgibacillus halodenitrificans TaxID=1482 RepID=UPI001FB3D650|nr:YqhV family protein [Virgibacillus halodenitrificans]MCJ0932085.1 YqhV family protein [Virgibacillus halodenitrificans]
MFTLLEKAVLGMALLRILSGGLEVFAAYLMIRFNELDKALIINGSLAFIGPLVLILTTAIGLTGLAEQVSFKKLILIILGVSFIIAGVKSN